jgi:hypothetical protein
MEFAETSIKLSHVAIAKADQLAYEIERYKNAMSCRAPEKTGFCACLPLCCRDIGDLQSAHSWKGFLI